MLEFWLKAAFVAVFAYLCGCFNGAVIVSKYILRNDVRNHGSGNAGLTNFYRVFGGGLTFVVIACDVLKAIVAVLVGVAVANAWAPAFWQGDLTVYARYFAGLFCLLGHAYPCMFQFRGGKGILSGGTIAIMVDWRVALVVWGGFLVLFLLTRYVSLGSVFTGFAFPVMAWVVFRDWIILTMAIIMGGLIVWKHRSNIKRLLAGNENKFSFHKKKA
ncbi:MAG: glycerol-3-phosphate 1-O-acyltransferase PlsY [Oscillospiraceae bacterium]|nr:glycerol-3-phosphate 1-O-acyltransferase PlsY [Oscillospiraceae bacterium]